MRSRTQSSSTSSIADISTLDGHLGRQVLDIYDQSFPEEERESPDEITGCLESTDPANPTHMRALVDDGEVRGFAYFSSYSRYHLGYLKYIAVAPDARGGGLGSLLLADTVHQVRADGKATTGWPHLGVVFEVERPELAGSDAERSRRDRRIEFYRRNGARMIDRTDFVAPPVDAGMPPIPFHLMVIPAVHKFRMHRWLKPKAVTALMLDGYEEPADSRYLANALVDRAVYSSRSRRRYHGMEAALSLSLARMGVPEHRRRRR